MAVNVTCSPKSNLAPVTSMLLAVSALEASPYLPMTSVTCAVPALNALDSATL